MHNVGLVTEKHNVPAHLDTLVMQQLNVNKAEMKNVLKTHVERIRNVGIPMEVMNVHVPLVA